eukprot:GHRR01037812.1.p1 GENE.GHRR01037812.1~~GHRR01037812.1.p1  ORF type:complete len:112 (-),score=21.71 GHRR01037812.1:232-567(-)
MLAQAQAASCHTRRPVAFGTSWQLTCQAQCCKHYRLGSRSLAGVVMSQVGRPGITAAVSFQWCSSLASFKYSNQQRRHGRPDLCSAVQHKLVGVVSLHRAIVAACQAQGVA